MAKNEKEKVMVWSDKDGTYKLGYSQYLMQEQNRINRHILYALVVLIALALAAMLISYGYVSRLDEMNLLSKMAGAAPFLLM